MRNLKVEYTALDYKDRKPSAAFLKELSGQLTPKITNLITDEILQENISKLVCLTLVPASYMKVQCQTDVKHMLMKISSLSAPLGICELIVFWNADTEAAVYPWDEPEKGSVYFDFYISKSAIEALNYIVPQLYHPIIKSEKSSFPFDYQMYYGGENLVLDFHSPLLQSDVNDITGILDAFVEKWNDTHEEKIHMVETKKISKTKIKCHVDFGGCGADAVEAMIHSFRHQNNIKKIICR